MSKIRDQIDNLRGTESDTVVVLAELNKHVPVGSIHTFPHNSVLEGFLECNGAELSRTTYANLYAVIGDTYGAGDGSTTFNIPDLRGEFIRGFDNGRGIDSGRGIGTAQLDEFKSHTHGDGIVSGNSISSTSSFYWAVGNTAASGGTETRPRNIAMMYCIKY